MPNDPTNRDAFPFEFWRGTVDTRLAGHDRELRAVRELIQSLIDGQERTRSELAGKVEQVTRETGLVREELRSFKRFLAGIALVVGFVAPLIVSLVVKFA